VLAKRSAIEVAQGIPEEKRIWTEKEAERLTKYYKELHQDPVVEEDLVPDTYPDA
jgi:hypothetical protein